MKLPVGNLGQEPQIDWERQKTAKQYGRLRRLLLALDSIAGAIFILVLLISGASVGLHEVLAKILREQILVVGSFFAVFFLAYSAIRWPLGYFGGYRLARRYGLSTQSTWSWFIDWLKSLGISLVFGLILVEILYQAIHYFPTYWWLVVATIVVLFSVVLANLAPVLLVPLFYRLTPVGDEELSKRIIDLSARAGAKVRGIYRMNLSSKTTAANAALMGLGNTRRVVLGDTLLDNFTTDEIETIYAHELGHHVHADIPLTILTQSITLFTGFYLASITLSATINLFGIVSESDVASLPLLALILGVLGALWMPLTNAFSRWLEHRADVYALALTGKAHAFRNAMVKLCNQNLSELHPSRWVEILLYDHPSVGRRIQLAEEYGARKSYGSQGGSR